MICVSLPQSTFTSATRATASQSSGMRVVSQPDCRPKAMSCFSAASPLGNTSAHCWQILASGCDFPPSSVGRGDMSRGGLMLRCAADGQELSVHPGGRRGFEWETAAETSSAQILSYGAQGFAVANLGSRRYKMTDGKPSLLVYLRCLPR